MSKGQFDLRGRIDIEGDSGAVLATIPFNQAVSVEILEGQHDVAQIVHDDAGHKPISHRSKADVASVKGQMQSAGALKGLYWSEASKQQALAFSAS